MEFVAVILPAVLTAAALYGASELVRRADRRTHDDE
jgi:hypothetical protein